MFTLIVSVLLLVIHHGECAMTASAVLYGDGTMMSYGTVKFSQDNADAAVVITIALTGLNASSAHGFHVHTVPVTDGLPNCTSAAGHLNPYSAPHGPRTANITFRHVGDLGNITSDANGAISTTMEDRIIQLFNTNQSIINRTVIVHRDRDDGGQGGFPDSMTTGNAGARIFCGLIKSTSNALSLKPTISVLLMTIFIGLMKFF